MRGSLEACSKASVRAETVWGGGEGGGARADEKDEATMIRHL